MRHTGAKTVAAVIPFAFLSGCGLGDLPGLGVPPVQEVWQDKDAGRKMEQNIKAEVYHQVRCAAIKAENEKVLRLGKETTLLPDGWGVQGTLSIEVDETASLNPGVSLITPMHAGITNFRGEFLASSTSPLSTMVYPFVSSAQQYGLGLGGTLSSQAFRTDKFGFYWDLDKLKDPSQPHGYCSNGRPDGILLESDLRIDEWLFDALNEDLSHPSSALDANADKQWNQDILSYEIKFIVVTSGNITPTWKLVRVATNNGNLPLAGLNRTRTHDLTVTFGPKAKAGGNEGAGGKKGGKKPTSEPSLSAANAHLASEIGLAVANALRSAPLQSGF
ncbi:MAG TPA: hypothetical protein VEH76_14870 [Methylocystis sp.]|nr:hypothetical protein [Methylocystis sp.]